MNKIVINKQLLPMKAHYFLWNAGTGPVVPFLSTYARQLGFSSVIVGFLYTVLPISGMLAKPIFGSIADRFHCQKMIFLIAQLLAAVAFLAIFYAPQIEDEHIVNFSCFNSSLSFSTVSENSIDKCTIEQIRQVSTTDTCQMHCGMDNVIRKMICEDWNITQYCTSSYGNSLFLTTDVPKSEINVNNGTVIFSLNNFTTDGKVYSPKCIDRSVSILCNITCNDAAITNIITRPGIKDSEVYGLYQFWILLFLMVISWVGQALVVSIGDAICFELLGDKPHRYGYQRLYGALGWGLIAALTGILIDVFSEGKSQKDYTCAFYMSAIFLFMDFVVSSRIQYTQKKISANIFRDIAVLLINLRILIYILWCIVVGMCTGLIWQFLFWLIEDLSKIQGCDYLNYAKTLQGLIQAFQCLGGEAPFFFLSGWILKKLGHINTMSLVLLAIGVRFILYSVISNPWWFLPVELMNGLTFGLFFACMASYASIIAPPGTEATMQGLVGAVFEGVGVSAGSSIAGLCYNKYGGPLTFRYFGFGSLIAFILHVVVQYLLKIKAYLSFEEYVEAECDLETTLILSETISKINYSLL